MAAWTPAAPILVSKPQWKEGVSLPVVSANVPELTPVDLCGSHDCHSADDCGHHFSLRRWVSHIQLRMWKSYHPGQNPVGGVKAGKEWKQPLLSLWGWQRDSVANLGFQKQFKEWVYTSAWLLTPLLPLIGCVTAVSGSLPHACPRKECEDLPWKVAEDIVVVSVQSLSCVWLFATP